MKAKLFTIPNILTLTGLLCGCMAAMWALRGDLQFAFAAIAAAALFDVLDGLAARLLRQKSPLGVQLDSLADMIGFGFAPAAILLELIQRAGGGYWGLAAFVLTAFAALRLAKFNLDERQSDEFRGLPTPAVGLLVGSIGYLVAAGEWARPALWMLLLLEGLLCALMICDLRMFSLKKRSVSRSLFAVACGAVLALLGIGGIPYIIGGYVVWSLVVARSS